MSMTNALPLILIRIGVQIIAPEEIVVGYLKQEVMMKLIIAVTLANMRKALTAMNTIQIYHHVSDAVLEIRIVMLLIDDNFKKIENIYGVKMKNQVIEFLGHSEVAGAASVRLSVNS